MPAIPTLARIEAYMTDDQLVALLPLLDYLVNDDDSPIDQFDGWFAAADLRADAACAMSDAVYELRAAARRTMRERNLAGVA